MDFSVCTLHLNKKVKSTMPLVFRVLYTTDYGESIRNVLQAEIFMIPWVLQRSPNCFPPFSLSLSSPFSHWLGNHTETQMRSTSSIQPRVNLWLTKVNPLSSCSGIWTLNSFCWGNSNGALGYLSLRIRVSSREKVNWELKSSV